MIRYTYRLVSFLVFFAAYIVSSIFVRAFVPGEQRKRRLLVTNTSRFCRVLLFLLGIRLLVKSHNIMPAGKGCLVLANHLSYLDVAVLSALFPAVFVTSYEVMNSPVEGLLARCGGSVFVDRRSKTTVRNDIRVLFGLLKQGFTVVVFPEGTSSSGEGILPFKSSLLHAALEIHAEILPVCINYRSIDGERVTVLNRDKIFYYGDMQFLKHLLGLLRLRSVDLEVTLLDCVPALISNRKSAAKLAFNCISAAYVAIH